ncbi:MAG: FAD binding domain-containing protein [Blastocatellia bacterium]|nr:FAD binding domain-containing protein [Blastocatellia bacterium]
MRDFIHFYLNGKPVTLSGSAVFQTLSDFLRYERGATGTKVVCAEGDCGACTVLLGKVEAGALAYRAVNSCIQSLYQLDCTHVITVEGVKLNGTLCAVQEAMTANHAAQCGYCTPGFVVSMCGLFDAQTSVTEQDIKDALTGNLCRCTGYEPIIKSGLAVETDRVVKFSQMYPQAEMLESFRKLADQPIYIQAGNQTFGSPTETAGAIKFKAGHEKTVVVQGATDVGVWCNKRNFVPPAVLSLSKIEELKDLTIAGDVVRVGARVTLSELEAFIKDVVPEFYAILNIFGAPQIKNAGTLAGNIANGSPIADTLPFLFVMEAELELAGGQGSRRVGIREFYKGYKTFDLAADEIIVRVHIPLPQPGETLKLYKVSKRKDLDISTFTAAIRLTVEQGMVGNVRIAYGGVGPVVLRLPRTEAFLSGKTHTLETYEAAGLLAREEITPISDVRGSSEFRFQLAENILQKFFYETC